MMASPTCSIYNDKLYMLSHKDAPKFKVVMTDMNNMDIAHAKVIQPEGT